MRERVTFNAQRGSLYTKDVAIVMDPEYTALNIGDLVRRAQAGDIESYGRSSGGFVPRLSDRHLPGSATANWLKMPFRTRSSKPI